MPLMGSLFGRSPVLPMQQHMKVAVACARRVLPLFEDMAAGNTAELASHRQEIDRLEHEADEIKNEIRSHLPRRLFMAVGRRDTLEILDYQDSIADVAQDIAELADQRGMVIPGELVEPLLELVRRVLAACELAERAIDGLDQLVEMGFRGSEVARLEEMIGQLSRLESDSDELAERAQRRLFAMEEELGVSTVFWYQLLILVGNLADYAERVGNRLRLLVAS
jgi:predicted phosphate transport protein (TIGR00153 family)